MIDGYRLENRKIEEGGKRRKNRQSIGHRNKAKARQDAFRRISMKSEDVVDSDFSSKFAPDALPPRFLDGETYRRIFALAKPIRAALESEERVMTVDNPIFMY